MYKLLHNEQVFSQMFLYKIVKFRNRRGLQYDWYAILQRLLFRRQFFYTLQYFLFVRSLSMDDY